MQPQKLRYTALLSRFSKTGSEEGTTLIEALISTVMFSLAVFAVVPTLTQFQLQAAVNADRSSAVAVAQQVLDQLRRTPTDQLASSGTSTTLPSFVGGGSTNSLSYRGQTYRASMIYCQTSTLCDRNSRQVIVQVSQNGRTIYTVETLFTKFE